MEIVTRYRGWMSDELARLQEESFERGGTAVRSSFAPERRLNALQLSRFLDGHVFAVAATTHPNATAHAAMSPSSTQS